MIHDHITELSRSNRNTSNNSTWRYLQDEDVNDLPVNWKPPVPDLDPEYGDKDNTCPCPDDYINVSDLLIKLKNLKKKKY